MERVQRALLAQRRISAPLPSLEASSTISSSKSAKRCANTLSIAPAR